MRFFLLPLILTLSGCGSEQSASVALGNGLHVNMALRSMFSLQSDWHRTLTISHDNTQITRELAADTGWWRGSNLYRAGDLYILDEGQNGCIAFRLSPLEFDDAAAKCSERRAAVAEPKYEGLTYLGTFSEINDGATHLAYQTADEAPERRLPDPR
ncbi:hypothetical protein GG681_02830 [Epibacterium sp. SM1969]|uniref:Lipoprotein n=1 Tax=Tritonibacter aquimaris TaxID=2663379 RepID=A0A844AU70_9RHOB|nr:hypothetical protein [Tritonibacter aquimaris]MQY41561.1 hypothetical protein [Tritonibacter aquimaris]